MKKYKFNTTSEFIKVEENDKWGVIDLEGNEIIPIIYDFMYEFKDGFFEVKLNDEYFWINQDGIKVNKYTSKKLTPELLEETLVIRKRSDEIYKEILNILEIK